MGRDEAQNRLCSLIPTMISNNRNTICYPIVWLGPKFRGSAPFDLFELPNTVRRQR